GPPSQAERRKKSSMSWVRLKRARATAQAGAGGGAPPGARASHSPAAVTGTRHRRGLRLWSIGGAGWGRLTDGDE
ncbi:hypothetical protein, partial [Kitasatospora sp. NPDC047058]|uniref:hypothetical protein n=1 Tax=Kitasatospora sp. NPDC047058 TaxID=3155620 RepID=UPI0033DECCBD